MSVTAYNYRFRNILYHTQGYFGLCVPLDPGTYIYDPTYMGFKNAFMPSQVAPMSSWENLTLSDTEYWDGSGIVGDVNGFDSTGWHSKCHIVASNSETYSIGFYTYRHDSSAGIEYHVVCAFWSTMYPEKWILFGKTTVTKGLLETIETAYSRLPEYFYLSLEENHTPNSAYYPYPKFGGLGYYDENSDFKLSTSPNIANYLIPVLIDAGNETEDNPDPEPTPIPNDDPYAPGGASWTGGGNGSFEPITDDVDIPGLPTLTASATGFVTLFNPSISQLRNLAGYMWSDLFDESTFKKLFADPMQCILGLSIVPVAVPSGSSATVKVGNVDTGISMTTASTQYVELSCGSLSIGEYFGSYLDYEPYTRAELYLPFIGIHPISIDDIMGKTISVTYHVDILSGACIAYVKSGGSVLYSFLGQCASSIPVTSNDWTNVINGVMNIAGSIGTMVATGGATAPMALGTIASTAVNSMKPTVEKSGSLSGAGGMMGIKTPYLIITRPRQAVPARQSQFIGYPSFVTVRLADISGYTEIDSVHLEGIQATGAELAEIESILKGGAIF